MLINLIRNTKKLGHLQLWRNFASEKGAIPKQNWDLCAGVLVERLPVVSKSLTSTEQEFQALLWQQEYEDSLKSDYELKHERDVLQAELFKKGEIEVDLDESSSKQTAQDLKDAYIEEYKKFKFAPRITEADKKNNLKSTERALEDNLYLLVQQEIDGKLLYTLPQGQRIEGETMRQTAERVLKEACGQNMNVMFYGNAPCAFYKFKYPPSLKTESIGSKVFLFRTSLKSGNVDPKTTESFEWQTKEHLTKKLEGTYMEKLENILF